MKDHSDAELVRRSKAGELSAFNELVVRHQEKIFNAVYRFCSNWDDALDITQRAFLNAFRSMARFKGDSAFSTWMYRIAFNQSVSFRREGGRHSVVSLTAKEGEKSSDPAYDRPPTERLEGEEDREKVRQALSLLAEEERQIIVLKDLLDHSYEEIAAILEIPKGTVRSRLHRARMELKEKLKTFAGTRFEEGASKGHEL